MGNDGAWWLLILLFAMGGWGNGGFGGYGNNQLSYDFPWLLQGQNGINANTNAGFDHAATQAAIGDLQGAVTSGFGNVATQLCNGFSGVNATINGAQNAISNQLYNNTIADLERSFAAQTANTQAMTALQAQLAQCCCDNRLATAQTQALVQSENCADRYEAAQNTQSIITAITSGIQAIKDDLCADRLEAERRENQNLRSELMYARGQASQIEQTAQIRAGQVAEVDALYNRLSTCPVSTVPVYGSQPVFTPTYSCGCGA